MAIYERADRIKFVNPYNFVSIDKNHCEKKDAEQVYQKQDELLTGYLECRLITKTPLAIPDAEHKKECKECKDGPHYKYPFYTIDGKKPVIPGSSIRGVLRNVYEAATDSCMVTMRDNTGLSKRNDQWNAYAAGLLIKEGDTWNLYPADKYLIPCQDYKSLQKELGEGGPNDTRKRRFKVVEDNGQRVIRDSKENSYFYGTRVLYTTYEGKKRGEKLTHKKDGKYRKYPVWDGIVSSMKLNQDGDGYVYIGEKIFIKHGEEVFVKSSSKPVKTVADKDIDSFLLRLEEGLKIYRNSSVNRMYPKDHSGYSGYENAKKNGAIPLWYDKNSYELSLASIGRIFYKKRLNELVGTKKPCEDRTNICKACALFGMIGKKSIGSRIRVTDATLIGDDCGREEYTLKELGTPRYSYLPFYANTKNIKAQKDKYGKSKGQITYDTQGIEIRGRKYYWHNLKANNEKTIYEDGTKTKRNATMEIIEKDNEFSFKVYYDSITKRQLEELLWCLTLGDNEKEGEHCHKIGHGKPLGLGSVKIIVDSKVERKSDTYLLESSRPGEEIRNPFQKTKTIQELMRITDLCAVSEEISYPCIGDPSKKVGENDKANDKANDRANDRANDTANHRWFSQNLSSKEDVQKLPEICDENQFLIGYSYKKEDKDQKGKSTHKR